jgi:hypothetical protein
MKNIGLVTLICVAMNGPATLSFAAPVVLYDIHGFMSATVDQSIVGDQSTDSKALAVGNQRKRQNFNLSYQGLGIIPERVPTPLQSPGRRGGADPAGPTGCPRG